MIEPISFFVPGTPASKGSARAFAFIGKNGKPRANITNDDKKAEPWAAVVTLAARDAMLGRSPFLVTQLAVRVDFWLARPKKFYRKRKGATVLRDDAPAYVSTKPDVDKLARCALDALAGVVFGDDALVVSLLVTKRYATGQTGANFLIEEQQS